MQFNPNWVEKSMVNGYGEKVVANVIVPVMSGDDRGPCFRCKDEFWKVAHEAWCKAYRENPSFPSPMSEGHCMFVTPEHYGRVPEGCTDQRMIRRARRHVALNRLDGWDRDLRKSIGGLKKLAKIIQGIVDAEESKLTVGHYLACLFS